MTSRLLTGARRQWDADLWWVAVLHQGDARSDLSAIHHLRWSEALALDGDEFGALVVRLVHYPGAVQDMAVKAFRASQQPAGAAAPTSSPDGVPVDPTPEQVKALRDAARRKRFGPEYGEHKHVGIDELMREAGRG